MKRISPTIFVLLGLVEIIVLTLLGLFFFQWEKGKDVSPPPREERGL